ncbi:MAG: rhomboid family intramembrane serine protease [Gammaproteobacteria bacterium]
MFPLHDDNPTIITPVVTVTIIALCIIVFVWELSLGPSTNNAIYSFGVIPAVLFDHKHLSDQFIYIPPSLTIFTSMFLHSGWMHLIGNMLYLWIFSNNVEDSMGHSRFIVFYLICGIAAALTQGLSNPESTIPMIGASGAISGILGAYLLLYPHAKVLVIIPLGFYMHTTRLPAGLVLGFWFILQLINSSLSNADQGGVAFGAHIGGFVAGMTFIPLFKFRHIKLFNPKHLY